MVGATFDGLTKRGVMGSELGAHHPGWRHRGPGEQLPRREEECQEWVINQEVGCLQRQSEAAT